LATTRAFRAFLPANFITARTRCDDQLRMTALALMRLLPAHTPIKPARYNFRCLQPFHATAICFCARHCSRSTYSTHDLKNTRRARRLRTADWMTTEASRRLRVDRTQRAARARQQRCRVDDACCRRLRVMARRTCMRAQLHLRGGSKKLHW
jgi:hypothetical protein